MNKLSQFVISYLEMCEYEKKLSPDTVKAYRIDLAQFLDFSEGGEVDVNTIDRYIRYLNQSFAPRTVKRKLASLRAFFHELELSGRVGPLLPSTGGTGLLLTAGSEQDGGEAQGPERSGAHAQVHSKSE